MNLPADELLGILLLIAVCALWLGPIQWVFTDIARQIVFESRDRLFDLAADGALSFESREYREIRSALERLIRFAHEATLLRVLLGWHVARRRNLVPMMSRLSMTINGINDEALRNRVHKLVQRASGSIGLMIIARSPVLLIAVLVAILILAMRDGHAAIAKFWRSNRPRIAERVQIEAEHQSLAAI